MIRRGSSRLCCVVPGCSWWWFSEPSLGGFLGVFSGPYSWGFDVGNLCEPFVVLLPLIPLPNPWVKGFDFGVFGVLGLEEFLAEFLGFLLIWQVLVGHKLGYGLPMRCSYYPQSLAQVRGAIREIKVWIWGSWPAGAIHPELPRLHRSDRCSWPVRTTCGICLGWDSCVFELWCCWFVLGLIGVVLLGFV
jgi:hypothetical protein